VCACVCVIDVVGQIDSVYVHTSPQPPVDLRSIDPSPTPPKQMPHLIWHSQQRVVQHHRRPVLLLLLRLRPQGLVAAGWRGLPLGRGRGGARDAGDHPSDGLNRSFRFNRATAAAAGSNRFALSSTCVFVWVAWLDGGVNESSANGFASRSKPGTYSRGGRASRWRAGCLLRPTRGAHSIQPNPNPHTIHNTQTDKHDADAARRARSAAA
jgi:hypothetical protein